MGEEDEGGGGGAGYGEGGGKAGAGTGGVAAVTKAKGILLPLSPRVATRSSGWSSCGCSVRASVLVQHVRWPRITWTPRPYR